MPALTLPGTGNVLSALSDEVFFERIAEAFHQPGGPNMPRIIEISAEHGIYFVPPEGA